MMKRFIMLLILFFTAIYAVTTPAFAESEIIPGYEVKFNLDTDAFANQTDMLQTFEAVHDEDLKVYYFDTPEQTFRSHHYTHRLRVYANDKKNEITYKKTFPDITVADAIEEAASKGFHGDMSNYKFENDRKEGTDTFSISRKEKFNSTKTINYDSINQGDVLSLLKSEAPKKYAGWDDTDWYHNTLNKAIAYGPASVQTYEGTFLGVDADLEIWNYKGETLVEISTKTPDKAEADYIENTWHTELEQADWLNAEQTSKTNFVMDR